MTTSNVVIRSWLTRNTNWTTGLLSNLLMNSLVLFNLDKQNESGFGWIFFLALESFLSGSFLIFKPNYAIIRKRY